MNQNNERKSFAAFAVTAALLLSSLPALAAPLASMSSTTAALSGLGFASAAVTQTLTITPSTVPYNATTIVTGTGTGFTPNAVVVVTATNPAVAPPATTADGNGALTFTTTIPAGTTPGTIGFRASEPLSPTSAATGTVVVTSPTLTAAPNPASPTSGAPATVTVSGTGYVTATPYTISCTPAANCLTATQVATATLAGDISATFPVTGPAGTVTFTARDLLGAAVATTTVAVNNVPPPLAALTFTTVPTNGVPLQSVTASGTGFPGSTLVTVTFTAPGGTLGQPVATATTSPTGTFSVPFLVPLSTPAGTATVSAGTVTGTVATAPFQVLTPTVTVTPSTAAPTTSTSVTGTGFTANAPVTVTLGLPNATPIATGTVTATGPTGAFASTLMVPANAAAGTYTVRAVDATGLTATTLLTVTSIATTTTGALTLVPVNGQACAGAAQANVVPSAPVNAFVSGFGPTETVNIVLNGATVASGQTNANGVATPQFTINSANTTANMTYTVSAIGLTTGRVATSNLYQCAVSQAANPSTVAQGQPVTLSGAGFGAGEVVSETIYNASATTPVTFGVGAPGVTQAFTATANATGGFSTVYTPTLQFGTYTARSQGLTTGLNATTSFTVAPTAVTSLSGPVFPCATFVISATGGFSPTEVVSLLPAGGTVFTATVNSTGGFNATGTAPANAPLSGLPVTITSARGTFTFTQPITVPTASLTVSPSSVPGFGSSTTVQGSGFIPNSAVNLATYFAGTNGLISAGGPTTVVTAGVAGSFTTTYAVSPTVQVINGQYTISATSQCSPANTAQAPVTVTTGVAPSGPPQQPTTLYFAEGYTGRLATNQKADFDEFISVLNPDNFAKVVTFTYQLQPNNVAPITTTTVFTQVVPANSDILRNVNGDVGNDQIVSAIVSSDFRIAAERVQNRTTASGRLDNDSSLGNTAPGTTWYFAEGYTGASFQEYLTVQNPSASTATYTVTFLPSGTPAAPSRQLSFTVAAHGRDTQNIRRLYNNAFVDPSVVARGGGESVGMVLNSTAPIVAERVMYWGDGVGSAKYGASTKAGLTNPASQFLFAFGSATGTATNVGPAQQTGDESFVTVINPNPAGTTDANVQAIFRDSSGKVIGSKFITVSPQTRETIVVNNVISTTAGPHWVTVSSDLPVFVEKPNYVGGSPNMGMHPGMSPSGSPAGLQFVLFPNVNTASASGQPISETVFLVNTGAQAETVVGTYYTPSGQTTQVPYVLAPNQQRVINVNLDAGNLPAGPLGAQYTTSGFGQFIAARIANSPDQKAYIGNQGVFNNQ